MNKIVWMKWLWQPLSLQMSCPCRSDSLLPPLIPENIDSLQCLGGPPMRVPRGTMASKAQWEDLWRTPGAGTTLPWFTAERRTSSPGTITVEIPPRRIAATQSPQIAVTRQPTIIRRPSRLGISPAMVETQATRQELLLVAPAAASSLMDTTSHHDSCPCKFVLS